MFKKREEQIRKDEREKIARLVSQAGQNNISLLTGQEHFTGTYWISANNLYHKLTGRHLNEDYESGEIPRNKSVDEAHEEREKEDRLKAMQCTHQSIHTERLWADKEATRFVIVKWCADCGRRLDTVKLK